jgi:hypothetical protein
MLKNTDMYTLLDRIKDKTLICFGAGQQLQNACQRFLDVSLFERIDFIADNNRDKKVFCFSGEEKPIYPIESCVKNAQREPVVLVTAADGFDLIEQLHDIPELGQCDCYVYTLVNSYIHPFQLPRNRAESEPIIIPKIIHYCWFGGSPIRNDFKSYIETWKKHCPDYEIVRWDESNYDYKKNEYMYDAYKHKVWGFVPDFARLDIIYQHGGVYLDTDVELLRSIDDLLCDEAYCGFQKNGVVANGLGFGAIAGFPLVLEQRDMYSQLSFINPDGSLNLKPGPYYQSELLRSKGLVCDNTLQKVQGMTVYPSPVLDPYSMINEVPSITENTYSIHHYAGTWAPPEKLNKIKTLTHKYRRLSKALTDNQDALDYEMLGRYLKCESVI